MPFVAELRHHKPYKPRSDLQERVAEVVVVLKALVPLQVHPSTKREMIDRALWLVAELSGDFAPRFRSKGVLSNLGMKIQRDHVFPRATLVAATLEGAEELEAIVQRAVCCLVTEEEHLRLSAVPRTVQGWERYSTAGVIVQDMLNYQHASEA